ncbi:uracil-DNA glycosylase [Candidatus Mycoplasma mahonii]|uniref:uracil-DNA glycosylase n=1 Tax=Candidatus Mycoplasma mahonii TaxID=3004105 RepID=UPI0026EB8F73|nr:uracil-DNA glycosylase [Candidatus Mycoplasma mahonii]WKX02457.1 uracil-DNA glycosylase [Candidatus Mycoplasma mahonii]
MNWPIELINEANKILDRLYDDNVSPSKNKALRFFNKNPDNIKIIILGQDPYPTPGVANGIAFAVNKDIKEPQSLKNIFKELIEVRGSFKTDKTLKHWEDQGVLMLNTSLTVEHGQPNSHTKAWKPFTNKLIKWMDNNLKITWVLWGNEAKKYAPLLVNKKIMDAHPSPLSVRHRIKNTFKELTNIDW